LLFVVGFATVILSCLKKNDPPRTPRGGTPPLEGRFLPFVRAYSGYKWSIESLGGGELAASPRTKGGSPLTISKKKFIRG
jgi:hypothetical protein